MENGRSWQNISRHERVVGMVYAASELRNAHARAAQDVVILKSALQEGYHIFIFVDSTEAFFKGRLAGVRTAFDSWYIRMNVFIRPISYAPLDQKASLRPYTISRVI